MRLNLTKFILNMKFLFIPFVLAFLSIFGTQAKAVEVKQIDLFLNHGMVIKNQAYGRDIVLNIHYVDSVDRVEKQISASLPADQNKAAAILKKRIDQTDIGQVVANAYLPSIKAAKLGIKRVPAAVINGHEGVFFGSTDIAQILTAAQNYQR